MLQAHGHVFHQRGPERRGAWPAMADGPRANILVYTAAAFLTALVTYLLVVGDRVIKPLVIAILAWHLINGMVTALANISERIRIRGKALPRSVRFVVALGVVMALLYWMVKVMVGNMGGSTLAMAPGFIVGQLCDFCLLYTSPSPRDRQKSRMPSSA